MVRPFTKGCGIFILLQGNRLTFCLLLQVNVTVKLGSLRDEKDTFTRDQEKMHLRSFYIADSTGSMSLTVWGNKSLSSTKKISKH